VEKDWWRRIGGEGLVEKDWWRRIGGEGLVEKDFKRLAKSSFRPACSIEE
jgi:hypothetical protein